MKKTQKPKVKIKHYVLRFLNVMVLVFIIGILLGAGTFKLIHNCRVETVEAMKLLTEESIGEQNTETIALQEEKGQEPEDALRSLGIFKLTAYCACVECCGKTDGITASGVKAVEGVTVAMDKSIPFGTKIYIDGVGERIVQDRGGAIKGNKIDIFFESHTKAKQFGVQYKEVFVS